MQVEVPTGGTKTRRLCFSWEQVRGLGDGLYMGLCLCLLGPQR